MSDTPSDLPRLMSLDPLQHTNESLDKIITELRAMRHSFNLGNMKAGTTKPKSAKEKSAMTFANKLNLDGLDL